MRERAYVSLEQVKRWADCQTDTERCEAVHHAVRTAPTKKAAAALLGVNRSYLYDLLRKYGDPRSHGAGVGETNTPNPVGPPNTTNTVRGVGADTPVGRKGGVGRSVIQSTSYLTSRAPKPSFGDMEAEPTLSLTITLPLHLKAWLEVEATNRKYAERRPHKSMGAVIVDLLEREMARAKESQ